MIPCRSEKHATHIDGNISGVENLQDKHGTVRHKVVGGVNEVILINEEHPNVNPRRSEAHATFFYSSNGGVANSRDEQGLVYHKVVGGVNKANIFNVEQSRVHVDSLNGFKMA